MLERIDNRLCCVVRVPVEMLAPHKVRVYDSCCGSAGTFVQGEKFFEKHCRRMWQQCPFDWW